MPVILTVCTCSNAIAYGSSACEVRGRREKEVAQSLDS